VLVLLLAGLGLSRMSVSQKQFRILFVKKTLVLWQYIMDEERVSKEKPPGGPVYDLVTLPDWEQKVLGEVAAIHGLSEDETLLLYVIRKIEDGGPGKELGVLCYGAMAFDDGRRSFWVQAHYAAFLIRKYYRGDLKAFQEIYCPIGAANDPKGLNKFWYPRARLFRKRWEEAFEKSSKD
jgi:hypothetical protein